MMARLLPLLLVAPLIAGCLSDEPASGGSLEPPTAAAGPGPVLGAGVLPAFTLPVLIDDLRAGGEPVIAITQAGSILVSAHPGYTHYHPDLDAMPPTGAELLVPTQAQSYLWRSTDGGSNWEHVTLLPVKDLPNSGPRGAGFGVSDPEFTVDGNGRIWFTDLEALASASVSWSDDDGASWIQGNPVGSQGPIDRQWLASFGDTLYYTGNYFSGRPLYTTTDGLMYTRVGETPCSGDFVAHPVTGTLYVGCGDGVAISTDGGASWEEHNETGVARGGMPVTNEPVVDSAGTIYLGGVNETGRATLAWSADNGTTWRNVTVADLFPELVNGTTQWTWVSAGSEGRASITFMGSPSANANAGAESEFFYYNVIVVNATSDAPELYPTKITPEPFHRGPICNSGTACQTRTATSDQGDRRLGDFFETTIDAQGFLHVVYSDTEQRPSDVISHVAYVRMTDGPRLVVGEVPQGFPTQG